MFYLREETWFTYSVTDKITHLAHVQMIICPTLLRAMYSIHCRSVYELATLF